MWRRCRPPPNVESLCFVVCEFEFQLKGLTSPFYAMYVTGALDLVVLGGKRKPRRLRPLRPRGSDGSDDEEEDNEFQSWSEIGAFFNKRNNSITYPEWWETEEEPQEPPRYPKHLSSNNLSFVQPEFVEYYQLPELAQNYYRHLCATMLNFVEPLALSAQDGAKLREYANCGTHNQWFPAVPPQFLHRLSYIAWVFKVYRQLPITYDELENMNSLADNVVERFDCRFPTLGLCTNYLTTYCLTDRVVAMCWNNNPLEFVQVEQCHVDAGAMNWLRFFIAGAGIQYSTTTLSSPDKHIAPHIILQYLKKVYFLKAVRASLTTSPVYNERVRFREVLTLGGLMVDPNYIQITGTPVFKLLAARVPMFPLVSAHNYYLVGLLYSIIHNDSIVESMPLSATFRPCILKEFENTFILSAMLNLTADRLERYLH